jgi:hypothetical protein
MQVQQDNQHVMAPHSQGGNSQQMANRTHEAAAAKMNTTGSATAKATDGQACLGPGCS